MVRNLVEMPKTGHLQVNHLNLDLENFRTVPQAKEIHSVHAMITINPDWFWALAHSLADEGYHMTENIIVLKDGTSLTVKEGNRRIAALKLLLGYIPSAGLPIPSDLQAKIESLPQTWKTANETVPCAIYDLSESAQVDRIVNLTHAKGEKAGRDKWNAVATARYNRDKNNASEPALDLLEAYLKVGTNLSADQKERWGGSYHLSVLKEAMEKVAPRIGVSTTRDLADSYPLKTKYRTGLDGMLYDIGIENLTTPFLRKGDYSKYGIPHLTAPTGGQNPTGGGAGGTGSSSSGPAGGNISTGNANSGGGVATASGGGAAPSNSAPASHAATAAVAGRGRNNSASSKDPRSVKRILAKFSPKGSGRGKVVELLVEARTLKLESHPHAFCFLLRSMFELSAKAYCTDHAASGLTMIKNNGQDKYLADALVEIANHLSGGDPKSPMGRELHGATTELKKADGLLSITAMNQLVHNPHFTIDALHICTVFNNIFPLLAAMNR